MNAQHTAEQLNTLIEFHTYVDLLCVVVHDVAKVLDGKTFAINVADDDGTVEQLTLAQLTTKIQELKERLMDDIKAELHENLTVC